MRSIDEETFLAAAFILISFLLGGVAGSIWAESIADREAFNRGYMVECVGKSGYYWGCEE